MRVKKVIKNLVNRLPYISSIYKENQLYRKNACYPPAHFYSPIVDVSEVNIKREKIWGNNDKIINGIDLNSENQILLLKEFEKYYPDIPFSEEKQENLRYYFGNSYYSYTDGILLYSFMRHFKPQRIVEVGSGFSSALMLDINEYFFNNSITLRFIEPFTERLESLLNDPDTHSCDIIEKQVQEVKVDLFSDLSADDILFIDSSHISKTGSDVNFLIFDVIPTLKKGVIIHFHDIFYPFEYPQEWVIGGRNWNEIYVLKAFLMNNNDYEILFFSHYIHSKHSDAFRNMPLAYSDHGCNFWLRKVK